MVNVGGLVMTTMMIANMAGKMTTNNHKEIRRGNSLIVNYEEVKLEKFDAEPTAIKIAEILKEHLPMIVKTKVFKHLDYGGRYKIDLLFDKPALSSGNQRIEGINVNLSSLRKATIADQTDVWKEITPKD